MADSATEQVLAQNALLAQGSYDIALLFEDLAAGKPVDPAKLQDLKTMVNALQPSKFTFK